MKYVLVISSQVASSPIGARAASFALDHLGHTAITLPTTMLGRHPGWGAPGGGAVPAQQLADMWHAISQQTISFDAVLTGYMADMDQIKLTAQIIAQLKQNNPDLFLLVDPVMGDATDESSGQLYIEEEVAAALIQRLLPLADLITPNLWEFAYLHARHIANASDLAKAAANMPQNVLITSVPSGDQIGAMLSYKQDTFLITHKRITNPPHGGGDLLAGLMLGHILNDLTPPEAMIESVSAVSALMQSYDVTADHGELPLIRGSQQLSACPKLPLQRMKKSA